MSISQKPIRHTTIALLSAFGLMAGSTASVAHVTDDTRPWTFWYWMYGAVSKPGIHADLMGMKQVGLSGCYLMPIRGTHDRPEYHGESEQLGARFWEMVDYSFQQADSLGLHLGLHICDGFALAGHPSITPEESMQRVVWTDTIVKGEALQGFAPRLPEAYQGYYEDIACYALPLGSAVTDTASLLQPLPIRSERLAGGIQREANGQYRATTPGSITYDLGSERRVCHIEIMPSGNNIQCQRFRISASCDGIHFSLVKSLTPARQGWQSTGYSFTEALPPTQARYIRLDWSPEGTEPGAEDLDAAKWKAVLKLRGVRFGTTPLLSHWRGKAGYTWLVAPETTAAELPDTLCTPLKEIIRLKMVDGRLQITDGRLTPTRHQIAPQRYYRILRMGHTSTGQTNATAGGGKGLEVDKFSPQAVRKLFDAWFKRFLDRPHSQVIKVLHVDSWECGTQNWGARFAEEFSHRRGYDLLDYLPVMTGLPIESATRSEQVLRDLRLTVNELVNEQFFGTLQSLAHTHGLRMSQESIAPTFVADGLEHYKTADLPMGEFWLDSPTHDKPNDMLDAISGAHLYGKNIVQAEGFTELRGTWHETPAMLKPLLDRQFALGLNRLVFHVNAHNPWLDRQPGMTLDGIGLFFQRDNTWYSEAQGLTDYITRCQSLLQQGIPVVDLAVFTGEEMPSRALTPDRLVPILPGLFGLKRITSEAARLANVGQLMTESPVGVTHSSGILDLKDWVNPLRGYLYDSMNRDALLSPHSRIEAGRLVMPGGVSYGALVLPGAHALDPSRHTYSPEVRRRLSELRAGGVRLIDTPYPEADLARLGLPRDVILPEGIAYTHRRIAPGQPPITVPFYLPTEAGAEIYFLSNQADTATRFEARFHVSPSMRCTLYDAVTDSHTLAPSVCTGGDYTRVPVSLAPYGSIFVIFSHGQALGTVVPPPSIPQTYPLTGPWEVTFERTGLQRTVTLPYDWSRDTTDHRITYYSGRAAYTSTFTWDGEPHSQATLRLGTLYDVAHIYVNHIDCGIVWTAPYETSIGHALRQGLNHIRIEVVNTWANALTGHDKGLSPFDGIWTNARYRRVSTALLPAGLTGPVSIRRP